MQAKDRAPHASALRKGRVSEPGRIYLVTTVTSGRQKLFRDFHAARAVIGTLHWLHVHERASSLAYVLMPDHLHWLLALGEAVTLPQAVHALKGYSARRINRALNREGGSVWQAGFHDHAVRKEEDLAALARYVIENPARAGLATWIGDYPHWDSAWL